MVGGGSKRGFLIPLLYNIHGPISILIIYTYNIIEYIIHHIHHVSRKSTT
jgi:hypothetical protein